MLDALQTNQCKTSLSLCENTLFLFIFKMLLKLNMNLKPADGAQTFNALIKWSLTLSACACPTVLLCALSVTQQCEITHWWFRLNVIQHCFTRLDSLHMPDLSVSVRLVVSGEKRGSRQQFPWGSSLITQRSKPTPGHFLPDLPQESRACWAMDHTCWSQTIPLPVPDRVRDRERTRESERESSGFYLPLAALTSCTLTLSLSLSLIH